MFKFNPEAVIVDVDRSFEKQSDVGVISLQNIRAARIITSDGKLISGNARDLAETAGLAVTGATWNVDPQQIPEALQQAWFAIEFGNFPAAASVLKKNLRSGRAELKTAAELLNSYVQQELQKQLDTASKYLAGQNSWEAYKIFIAIPDNFEGYEIPNDVSKQIKSLGDDENVKSELAAIKEMNTAQKVFASSSPSSQKRAASLFERLIEDFPGTEAARAAQKLLDGARDDD